MAETKSDRGPSRDYPSLSESPWGLWDLMFKRRSCRKYVPGELGAELPGELARVVALALETRGAAAESIIPVTDPGVGASLRKRSYKGFANKINVWLSRAPANAFLVMDVPQEDLNGQRPSELPKASMAMEDCVLWLTGKGFGTCWLGGVNSAEISSLMGLGSGIKVPAVVCFGSPRKAPATLSFDNFMRNALSRKRKPLTSVAYVETMQERYLPAGLSAGGFSAPQVQDVAGLLEALRDGRTGGGASLDLAVEACLEAARIAPSASNFQPWDFIVIKDAKRLEQLADLCGENTAWRAAIVAAGTPGTWTAGLFDKPFWMIDVPIALSHMSLMAASMGCGARVFTDGIDEGAINSLVRAERNVRTVGVMRLI